MRTPKCFLAFNSYPILCVAWLLYIILFAVYRTMKDKGMNALNYNACIYSKEHTSENIQANGHMT